ncbi:MAG: heme exporter protein CcmB [candidate division KSB1 bacterium]|nr:heme exporter protein CcmB [candidate division KSB1 bacterium]MDZ7304673.1 heme exporter protein CcmB [candidate division KSB1 bacterium]MDZ7313795.1 heme exporter protein CcmB [candidate division KSB1 bacterium]
MNEIRKLFVLVWKDLLAEFRTKEMLSSMLMFALIVVVVFNFTFDPGSRAATEAAPGILWVAFTFAGVLGLHRAMVHEVERGCLHGLMLAPVERGIIFLGKALGNAIFIFLIELPTFVLFAVFFNIDLWKGLDKLAVIFFLGTIGFAAVGTLLSAISVNTRTREIMLPILLFPIEVPVILSAVNATSSVLQGEGWNAISGWLKLLAGFDLVFLLVCYVTFEYVLEE